MAIADAPKTVIPVELTKGINDFSVSIVGPGGESDPSAVVRYVFDAAPPKITITSPKNNAVVNGKAVTIKGKTQARTTLLARNDANGSSIAGTAGADGTFTLSLALAAGVNKITITGTDPAGQRGRDDAQRPARVGQADRHAHRVDLPDQALQAARAGDAVGDRDRSGRQGAGRRRRDVHPEHAGHPDRHRSTATTDATARRRSRRRSPRAPTSARAARPSWSRPTTSARPQDYTVITIAK